MQLVIGVIADRRRQVYSALIKSLREHLNYQGVVYVFLDAGARQLPIKNVVYRPSRNRLGIYGNWRRALKELAAIRGDRYLLFTDDCVIDANFPTALAGVTEDADIWFPFCSEHSYTSAFNWDQRPSHIWFDRVGSTISGWHAAIFSSQASIEKVHELLPANTHTGLSPEELIGNQRDKISSKLFHPTCAFHNPVKHGVGEFTRTFVRSRERIKPTVQGNKLRVGFVVQVLLVGGTETWLLNTLKGLSQYSNIELTGVVVAGGGGAAVQVTTAMVGEYCPVYVTGDLSGRNVHQMPSPEAIAKLAEESDVLVVWATSDHDDLAVLATTRTKVVGVNHGCFDWWMARMNNFVDAWATVSEISKQALPRPGEVINNGLSFKPSSLSKQEAKKNLGLPDNTFVVCYAGRLSPEKRIKEMAECFDSLPKDKYSWLVVGPANPSVNFLKHRGENFYIFPPTTRVADYLVACDAAIIASEAEGFCYGALEPLLADRPLISTEVGIVGELLDNCPEAIEKITITPNENAATAIRKAVISARTNILKLNAAVPKAKKFIQTHLSPEASVKKWHDYLWRVCKSETRL